MREAFQYFNFSFPEVSPTLEEVLQYMQSDELEEEHPARVFVKDIMGKMKDIEGISGGYRVKNEPVSIKDGVVFMNDVNLNVGKQIGGYLNKASFISIFLCTAGSFFTEKTKELNQEGNIMEAYILDVIGSLTVKCAMDKIQQVLSDEMRTRGLNVSNRYSPGYCNWNLAEQKKLFLSLGEHSVKISLSESCLMIPEKSISGIIGIGENIRKLEYDCKICNNNTCIYRKIIQK